MNYNYPKIYKVKSLEDQWKILNDYLKLPPLVSQPQPVTPKEADGLFLIPHWKKAGRTYNRAVENVLSSIKDSRPFYNWRENQLGQDYLRQTEAKAKFWQNWSEEDLLVVPLQTGLKYQGQSVKNVRQQVKDEVLLGAYEVATILLTHPERLEKWEDLGIDCAGDEYDYPGFVVRWDRAPVLYFSSVRLYFGTGAVVHAGDYFGAGSFFLPQAKIGSRTLETFEPSNLEARVEKLEAWMEQCKK